MNQIEKNTVSAKGQLKETEFVTFLPGGMGGKKYLFVGNSITRHGLAPAIGWNRVCGMAASSEERDYVHLLAKKIRERDPDAEICVCQVAEWERNYLDPAKVMALYAAAREFSADVIVMRCVENCPAKDFDEAAFEKRYLELIDYLNPTGKAKIVLTTGFWKHPGDGAILRVGEEELYPTIYLGDLGEDEKMKAIGLFEHSGVANHPGDLGMQTIANAIWEKIQ